MEMDVETTDNRRALTPDGRVYVLRLWYEGAAEGPTWRASIRQGSSGERRYFLSVDECLEHLYAELLRG